MLRQLENAVVVGLTMEHLEGGNNRLASGHSVHDDSLLVDEKGLSTMKRLLCELFSAKFSAW
jgi:hypothetical protein